MSRQVAFTRVVLAALTFACCARAQPISLDNLVNNYGFILPFLPKWSIAQGSIFALFGTNLAGSTAAQNVPLQTSFGGVTVSVTVNGTTTQAIPYYVSPGQITALDRSHDQVFTWSGGIAGSYVSIFGYSYIQVACPAGNGSDDYVSFTCSAPVSAGQFTVPAAVLESLLPSDSGVLGVTNGNLKEFSAPGLDLGLTSFSTGSTISAPFR